MDDSNDVFESFDVDEVLYWRVCCVLLFLSQSLLDGDSEMEDGEIENKVSVSVVASVYMYV